MAQPRATKIGVETCTLHLCWCSRCGYVAVLDPITLVLKLRGDVLLVILQPTRRTRTAVASRYRVDSIVQTNANICRISAVLDRG